METIN